MVCYYLQSQIINNRIITTCSSNSLFFIFLCKFIQIGNLNINGGAINLISPGNSNLYQNEFNSCFSNNGGPIYFQNLNSSENKCNNFFDCFATSWGQTVYTDNINSHYYSDNSISFCSKNGDYGRTVVYLCKGKQYFNNGNLSFCWLSSSTAHDSLLFVYATSISSLFNNIIHNKLTVVINLAESYSGHLNFTNIINNTKVSDDHGLIYDEVYFGIFNLNNCLFIQNNQITFSKNSGKLRYENCFFSQNTFLLPSGHQNQNQIFTHKIYICKSLNTLKKIPIRNFQIFFKNLIFLYII